MYDIWDTETTLRHMDKHLLKTIAALGLYFTVDVSVTIHRSLQIGRDGHSMSI